MALGLVAAHAGCIHLLVADVVMPETSGGDLARPLIAARPDMKVLSITGYPDDTVARHGVVDPSSVVLQKPFSPETLLHKVRDMLDDCDRQGRSPESSP